MSSQFLDL